MRLDDVDRFLSERFGKRLVVNLKEIHEIEEHRPIETLWDVTTAVMAYAAASPTPIAGSRWNVKQAR
jgi:hypothetical protein